MTGPARLGLLGRFLATLGGVLARGILGRSAHAHMKQFTGSDEYWDRVIAAQGAWSREPLRGAGLPGGPPPGASWAGPPAGDTARIPPASGHELIPGWTESQLFDASARTPTPKVSLRICATAEELYGASRSEPFPLILARKQAVHGGPNPEST
jgi:hypothetical protein